MSSQGDASGARARLASWLLAHAPLVQVASALVVVAGVLALARFQINSDLTDFFPRGDPVVELTHRLYGDAYQGRALLIVLRHEDPRALDDAMPAAVERLRASPLLERVLATREEWLGPRLDWMLESPLGHLPDEARAALRDRLAGPGRRAQLEDLRRRVAVDPLAGTRLAQSDPLGVRWLFEESLDRESSPFPARLRPGSPYVVFDRPSLALVRVLPRQIWWDTASAQALVDDLKSRLSAVPLKTDFAGGHVSNAAQTPRLMNDLKMQIVSSAAFVAIFLVWMTRHPLLPLVLVLPIAAAILCALGFGSLALGPVAPTTVAVAAILMGQGIDFGIHVQSRYRQQRSAYPPDVSFENAYTSIGRPLLGAGATTLAVFLTLMASRFPGLRQLGVLLAGGLALCTVFSLTCIPLLVRASDRFIAGRAESVPWIVRGARAAQRSRARVGIAAALLAAGLASWAFLGWRGLSVDLDVARIAPPDDPTQATLSRLEKDLGMSLTPVFALVETSTPLDRIRESAEELRRNGVLAYSDGPHQIFPSSQASRAAEDFLRSTEGWVASTLKELEELGFKPEPFRRGLEDLRARLSRPAPGEEALARPEFAVLRRSFVVEHQGRKHWVLHLFPPHAAATAAERAAFDAAVRARLTGLGGLFSAGHIIDYDSRLLRSDLVVMSFVALASVTALTLLSVKCSLRSLLALLPVGVATGVMLAMNALSGQPLNLLSMTALPLVIGIGVDDGIYYLCRHDEPDRPDADRTLLDIGPGIWGSAATTVVAFASLTLSISRGLASLGWLVIVGRMAALLVTVFVLPVLVGRSKGPRP